MSVDPLWDMVPLLVPCSASPFVEARHAYTVNQGTTTVTFDSGVKPASSWAGSAYFSGVTSAADGISGTMLRVGTTDDFTLGTGDFTIEAWCSVDTLPPPNDSGVDEYTPYPIIERSNGAAGGAWSLEFYSVRTQGAPDVQSYAITFYAGDISAGSAFLRYDWSAGSSYLFDWHHYAVTRNGNEWTLWADGVPLDRDVSTVAIASPGGAGADIRLGNSILDTSSLGFSQTQGRAMAGYIAGARITKGWCRYGRSFEQCFVDMTAPPGTPYPESGDTGDYSGSTFTGAQGATGANATGEPEPGPDGEGGAGIPLTLPAAPAVYDQRNEDQTRRLIEAATRR